MQFNTALCLALLGLGLVLLQSRRARLAAVPLAVAALFGVATLGEYATGRSFGVDQLLFRPWLLTGAEVAGRMPRSTAVCVTVLAVAATWIAARGRRSPAAPFVAGTAGSLVAGAALVALLGYVLDVEAAYTWWTRAAMAPATAATLLLLGIGYVAAAWQVATTSGAPRWLPVPIGVGAVTATLFLWQALVNVDGGDDRTISPTRAAGVVLAIGFVFAALLAVATVLGQNARRGRRAAESMQRELLQRAERDQVLRAAYEAVSTAPDLPTAFEAFCVAVGTGLDMQRCRLSMVNGDEVTIVAAYGEAAPTDRNAEWSVAEAPVVIAGAPRAVLWFATQRPGGFDETDRAFVAEVTNAVGGALYTLARLEDEQQNITRLRELDQLKNEFVGVVAHDLRSPMTVIAGYVDTVLQRWDVLSDETKRELLEVASRNTRRLSVLVEDVLQVARIESGDFPYSIARFDLGSLVRRTAEEMTSARPDRPVVAEVPGGLPPVAGDEDRLWRVLTNLVSNAQKFSPDAVPVVVSVGADDDVVEVCVADRGPGIPEEDLPRLFGKFSRLGNAPSGEKGTGLGLYICKALVEAQGGTIDVESRVGRGTTMRFTVPRARSGC
jgi:signal transduction histidine kinase